ncbi:MAG: hypothetical protein JXQ79_11160 [Rhodobacteraceae bacterium]|nr:hypothetical protein [Paracoccaceae bacterium]
MILPDSFSLLTLYWPEIAFLVVLALLGIWLVLRGAKRDAAHAKLRAKGARFMLVDGSNVMHWRDNIPNLKPVCAVVASLQAQGYTPGVVFDANVGYKLEGRYRNHYKLAKRLGLPHEQVMVVPKGEPADPMVLRAARDYGGRVVSQDKFRDWEGAFPELRRPDFRVQGGYDGGKLWLDLPAAQNAT